MEEKKNIDKELDKELDKYFERNGSKKLDKYLERIGREMSEKGKIMAFTIEFSVDTRGSLGICREISDGLPIWATMAGTHTDALAHMLYEKSDRFIQEVSDATGGTAWKEKDDD